jgi:hypothetical protein
MGIRQMKGFQDEQLTIIPESDKSPGRQKAKTGACQYFKPTEQQRFSAKDVIKFIST